MHLVLSLLPMETTTPDADTVTPGVIGFITMLLLALVTIGLVLDMVRRLRRMRYRDQARETIAAEQAAAAAGQRPAVSDPED